MNKIKLNLNTIELKVLSNHLELLNRSISPYRQIKVMQSVLLPLLQRLINKVINIKLSNQKKCITLSYHEAHYLEIYLKDISPEEINLYNANVILIIRNELNQKLA